jgi:hypothetical protein
MPKGIRGFQLGLPRPAACGTGTGDPQRPRLRCGLWPARIVKDPIYQRNLYSRAIMGEFPVAVEKALMAYTWGDLLFSLVASRQIKLRRIDGWRKIAAVLSQHTLVAV